jgi:hypothetical protein
MYVGVVMISKTPRLEGWREKAREARNEDGDWIRSWRVGQDDFQVYALRSSRRGARTELWT